MSEATLVQRDRSDALPPSLQRLAELGSAASDTELTALRKRVLNLATAFIAAVAPVWVITYGAVGLWLSAAIPLGYIVVTTTLLALQAHRPSYIAFRFTELAMILVLPFLLQWSLGGFADSSVVSLWALTAPLGAVFFIGVESGLRWFWAFLALLAVSAALEPVLATPDPPIPEGVRVALFVLTIAGVSATVLLVNQYFVRAREVEHARSEALLLNVLPRSVAERLKRSRGVIADAHPEATVVFADIVGFTALAERLEPERLVELLDRIFTGWDALAERHGLEKIKTVGDEYMVVAGVPEARSDHVEAAAQMALEMIPELTKINETAREAGSLQARIGIDAGPVVAGVIGRSKFIYDLWGDTVNTASRMESTGVPGRIQVSARMRARLGGEFDLTRRGEVEVKGKGPMTTWFLDGGPAGR